MSAIPNSYLELAESLAPAGVRQSNMFGMPVLKLGRRPIGGLESDGVMFKLPVDSPEMAEALSLGGAHVFTPSMNGRTARMKQWVVVPFEHGSYYYDFALRSIRFVEESE